MLKKIIYDSNIWISFLYEDDSNFEKAKEIFAYPKPYVLTDYIILEVSTVLKQKAGEDLAKLFLANIIANDIEVLLSNEYYQESVKLFIESRNKLSFVDTSLVVLSEKYKIITFDKELARAIAANKN